MKHFPATLSGSEMLVACTALLRVESPPKGSIFQVYWRLGDSRDTSGKLTVLYQLRGGKDGATPVSGLAHDSLGNWYGTAAYGGSEGDGVVFHVKP